MQQRRFNILNASLVMQSIRSNLQADPNFSNAVRSDPITVLSNAGIPRQLAVNMLANDQGVAVGLDWCVCTACCCTDSCCITTITINLPLASDQAGWKALATGPTGP